MLRPSLLAAAKARLQPRHGLAVTLPLGVALASSRGATAKIKQRLGLL